MINNPQAHQDSDDIDIFDLITILYRYKLVIFIIASAVSTLALIYAFTATPIYRAEAIMAPAIRNNSASQFSGMLNRMTGSLASLGGISLDAAGPDESKQAIAYMESRKFLYPIINDLNLKPDLFPDYWDSETERWHGDLAPRLYSDWYAYDQFRTRYTIIENPETMMITANIEWEDPETAKKVLDAILLKVNRDMQNEVIETTEKNIQFLTETGQKISNTYTKDGWYRLMQNEIERSMVARATDEYAFKIIDPPVVPIQRARPQRKVIAVVGGFLGLLLGFSTALVHNMYVNRQRRKETA